jgi:hypothetical protein
MGIGVAGNGRGTRAIWRALGRGGGGGDGGTFWVRVV